MANTLLITKETGGYFSFVLNGNTAKKIQSIGNDLLIDSTQCHFKTRNGANIVKEQSIYPNDVTLVAGGTFTFTTTTQLWNKLIEVGYFSDFEGLGKLSTGGYTGTAQNLDDAKVDKVTGKSLISDTEITRLSTLSNFNDASIQAELDTKLNILDYNEHFKGVYLTESALNTALPTASVGDYAQVNIVGATDVVNYNWDAEENIWVKNATQSTPISNTDALPEGTSNLYLTGARVLATLLSGLSLVTDGTIVSTDSVLIAFGKLQKQITDNIASLALKANDNNVVHLNGTETITGVKTFNNNVVFGVLNGMAWDNTNVRLGIGTTSPTQVLDVVSTTSNIGIRIKNIVSGFASFLIESNRTSGNIGGITFKTTGDSFNKTEFNSDFSGSFYVSNGTGISAVQRSFTVFNDGNFFIGEGSVNNGFKFEVAGTSKLGSTVTLGATPTTSAGTYEVLTRNTSTGVIEKKLSSDFATAIIPNDATAASISNVGKFRYYTSGNNSYVDMCMQTGASTYAWTNITQNNW